MQKGKYRCCKATKKVKEDRIRKYKSRGREKGGERYEKVNVRYGRYDNIKKGHGGRCAGYQRVKIKVNQERRKKKTKKKLVTTELYERKRKCENKL